MITLLYLRTSRAAHRIV